jgi:hypothetical protein
MTMTMQPSLRTGSRVMRRRAACRTLAGSALLALVPVLAMAQPLQAIFPAVVQVQCRLPDGKSLISTGFAWRDPLLVVTALHGAAGCQSLNVFSEVSEKRSPARVLRAHLESDLALLQLERGIDLKPLQHAASLPDMQRERFTVIGYPQGIRTLDHDEVRFTSGVRGWTTTLEVFDSLQGKADLFAGVAHPLKTATIFRVKSLLQPGQSGAPIVDSQGRVVAVVSGGMLDGDRGLNWSIPAHLYLPQLPESPNAVPRAPSRWTAHFASRAPLEPQVRDISGTPRPEARPSAGALRRLHTRSLAEVEAMLRRSGRWDRDGGNITFIRQILGAQDAARLGIDILYDPVTGATFGVPTGLAVQWNAQQRSLEAATPSGQARLYIGVQVAESFAQAKTAGKRAFIDWLLPLARWQVSPATLQLSEDSADEYAQSANFFPGRDASQRDVSLNLSVKVLGRGVLGYAVLGPKDIVQGLSDQDRALYLMMQYGVHHYSDFARQ